MTRPIGLPGTMAVLGVLGALTASPVAAQSAPDIDSTTSFRGLGLAADGTLWASGTGGTVLRSTDGGMRWQRRSIADAGSFDLRDIEAVSATTAYAMVAGADTARIYKTTDSGLHWVRQYDDTRKGIFLDGIAFWDELHGIAVGDPMDGRFVILSTDDGGAHWVQRRAEDAPRALRGEAVFAASGSSITVGPSGRVWIGTGGVTEGAAAARVLRSTDYGRTWAASETPIPSGTASTGIFSLAFRDPLQGVAVGGDYASPNAKRRNIAITTDGGKTWQLGDTTGVTGYLSAVFYVPTGPGTTLVATGTVGTFGSRDGGHTWSRFNASSYNVIVAGKGLVVAGDKGRTAVWPSLDAAQDKSAP